MVPSMTYTARRNPARCPTHPGALLREDLIPATGRTKSEIASLLGISRQHLYDILRERKPVSPSVAVRLGKLFGDGAGAVILEASDTPGILSTHLHADGAHKELLYNPVGVSVGFQNDELHGVRVLMKGNEVFRVAVRTLSAAVDEALAANGLSKSDIDWMIPHQANLRIIQAVAKHLDMPMDRVVVTVDRHGNCSAGSVPLALDHAVRSGQVQRGQTLLLEAFGGGFTWGSALVRF